MSTIVGWFPSVAPLRDAVLDLFTSGVPRPNVSVVLHSPQGEQATDSEAAIESSGIPDFVAALPHAGPLNLADNGPLVGAGSIMAAIAEGSHGSLADALAAHGVTGEHASLYADELRRGGALLIVQSDETWDTVVQGVFRRNNDPSLRAEAERAGPMTDDAAPNDEPDSSITASMGALSGGMVTSGWGEPGVESQIDEDERIARERGGS
jgi:hypothetical protein